MTAKTAKFLSERLVDKTFKSHVACRIFQESMDPADQCRHYRQGTIFVARAMEAGLKIGTKRATLDVRCPYSTSDPGNHVKLLLHTARRIEAFGSAGGVKLQVKTACKRIEEAIIIYANRNVMLVIAEAAR